jgi:preprotein translocase subunit SecG
MLNIFARSLASEGMWMAMPFFIASVLYALAMVSTTFIQPGKSGDDMGSEEEEDEGLRGG